MMLHQQQYQPPPQHPPHTADPAATNNFTRPDAAAGEAPPKQVAVAMERLSQASRLIADIRLGADRMLEALFMSSESHQSVKPLNLFHTEDASVRQHLQELRSIGQQLEEYGVLNEALRLRSNSWGLHMPLVCPDGAVVAYAWKRQLAGQAGASAVDRTRLALKSFTDQKRRFFPHLEMESASKKHRVSEAYVMENPEMPSDCKTLADMLTRLEKEIPDVKTFTYERLEWLKRASALSSSVNDDLMDPPREHGYRATNNLRHGSLSVSVDKVSVIELLIPSVFRAVISLHPVGSTDPDAVAFFSPDEAGSYVHARGSSIYQVFRHVTEFSNMALQYFLGTRSETALYVFLHWVSNYQSLFTQACRKCGRLLSMDRQSVLLLPPVHRSYRDYSASKISSMLSNDRSLDAVQAYHVGCSPPDL